MGLGPVARAPADAPRPRDRRSPCCASPANRRTKAFDRQLPDVLSTIASIATRRATASAPGLRGVADDGSPPASEEFARVCSARSGFGRPLDEAIAAMCERIGSPDLDYVATAIKVQAQAGGSMAIALRHALDHGSRAPAARKEGEGADVDGPDVGDDPHRPAVGLAALMALINRDVRGAALHDDRGTPPDRDSASPRWRPVLSSSEKSST
jgi:hypothetical protein